MMEMSLNWESYENYKTSIKSINARCLQRLKTNGLTPTNAMIKHHQNTSNFIESKKNSNYRDAHINIHIHIHINTRIYIHINININIYHYHYYYYYYYYCY